MSRVRIGTCSGPADAALLRSMFSAHGIPVVIGAENHASMLGGLGGAFLSLDIWVDEADREEAEALLHELHEQAATPEGDDEDDGDDENDDENDDDRADSGDRTDDPRAFQRTAGASGHGRLDGPDDEDDDDRDSAGEPARASVRRLRPGPVDSLQLRIERRRRTGIVLLLGCFLTFGTAHMFTRAWVRGIALAGLEVLGFMYLGVQPEVGGSLVGAAIVTDVLGALWRVRSAARSALPEARVREH
ncbi:MAG TPA: DUF2007 domain-containing protein [Kofleriaceae bacterium]|nr:DUF2007 domain-containing protein [Kofleriaceae bacterium]